MSNPSRMEGDYQITGTLSVANLVAPTALFTNDNIAPGAGISASKLQQQYLLSLALTKHTEDAATMRRVIHVAYGATGSILAFHAGSTQAAGSASSCVVDLKKNGSSILTAFITLNNSYAAFEKVSAAGFTSSSYAAGNVFEVEITSVSGASLPKGVFVRLLLREDAD